MKAKWKNLIMEMREELDVLQSKVSGKWTGAPAREGAIECDQVRCAGAVRGFQFVVSSPLREDYVLDEKVEDLESRTDILERRIERCVQAQEDMRFKGGGRITARQTAEEAETLRKMRGRQ